MKRLDDQERDLRYREYVRLLAEHERQLAGYVHALVPLWQDAEDVLQDTKLRLWEQFDTFQLGTNFAAWSFTIAGYLVRKHRKDRQRSGFVSATMSWTGWRSLPPSLPPWSPMRVCRP